MLPLTIFILCIVFGIITYAISNAGFKRKEKKEGVIKKAHLELFKPLL